MDVSPDLISPGHRRGAGRTRRSGSPGRWTASIPVVFIDALMVKIRDGVVTNRAVLCWPSGSTARARSRSWACGSGPRPGESAKFWMSVLSEVRGRGVADVCIVCCDGLTGLPDAISVVWPQAVVQLCVVHLIRASLRYASRKYWAGTDQGRRRSRSGDRPEGATGRRLAEQGGAVRRPDHVLHAYPGQLTGTSRSGAGRTAPDLLTSASRSGLRTSGRTSGPAWGTTTLRSRQVSGQRMLKCPPGRDQRIYRGWPLVAAAGE